jgi:hypothetical protein
VYYQYDIHGNLEALLNDYGSSNTSNKKPVTVNFMNAVGNNRFKLLKYQYDLISGKVNLVQYQPGEVDQFYHRYEYDAENRLTRVFTSDSKDKIGIAGLEEQDAQYDYYKHGPLARTILGQLKVQGIDYAYTLQGWLKGVNSSGATADLDMGRDGTADIIRKEVAQDAFGFNLNYFANDYSSINQNLNPFPGYKAFMATADYHELFNGNISSMAVSIPKLAQQGSGTLLYNYTYNQLNRLKSMDAWKASATPAIAGRPCRKLTITRSASIMMRMATYFPTRETARPVQVLPRWIN